MTTFTELVADVTTITNRPDLVNETKLAIRSATLKAHHRDFFYKDLFEVGITCMEKLYIQTIYYKDVVPKFRAVSYLRKSNTAFEQREFLTLITPEKVVDSYGINIPDSYYVAGLELKIRTRDQTDHFLFGCYVHPKVLEDDYDSWVADEYPLAIIYEAAATVFKLIGLDEQAAAYRDLVAIEYAELVNSNIVATTF